MSDTLIAILSVIGYILFVRFIVWPLVRRDPYDEEIHDKLDEL